MLHVQLSRWVLVKWKRGMNLLGIWVSMSQWGNDYSRLSLRKFSERFKQLQLIPFAHCVTDHSMTGLLTLNLSKKQLEQCTLCNTIQLRQILVVSDEMYYDMIYLLTAIGLSPGGSSTVHIYTQTIHRTIQNNQYIEHNNWRVRAVHRLG
jgi:hypothetical protein